jgi:hypothetical protein
MDRAPARRTTTSPVMPASSTLRATPPGEPPADGGSVSGVVSELKSSPRTPSASVSSIRF